MSVLYGLSNLFANGIVSNTKSITEIQFHHGRYSSDRYKWVKSWLSQLLPATPFSVYKQSYNFGYKNNQSYNCGCNGSNKNGATCQVFDILSVSCYYTLIFIKFLYYDYVFPDAGFPEIHLFLSGVPMVNSMSRLKAKKAITDFICRTHALCFPSLPRNFSCGTQCCTRISVYNLRTSKCGYSPWLLSV